MSYDIQEIIYINKYTVIMFVSMYEEVIDNNEPQQRRSSAGKDDVWMYYDNQETVDINRYTLIKT